MIKKIRIPLSGFPSGVGDGAGVVTVDDPSGSEVIAGSVLGGADGPGETVRLELDVDDGSAVTVWSVVDEVLGGVVEFEVAVVKLFSVVLVVVLASGSFAFVD